MHKKLLLLSFVLPIFMGCSLLSPGEISGETTQASLVATSVVQATERSSTESLGQPPVQTSQQTITIIYTSDEHGWMEGTEAGCGAANMISVWQDDLGYTPGGPFLVLSEGNMWTGPAISTWFQGESMVEVMNTMGYDASAVGNHEFDFGLDALKKRISEMRFPLLAANIHYKDGSFPQDLGLKPYTVVTVSGVPVGVIGLATITTPQVTNPVNVADFEFGDYAETLHRIVPEVKAAGAELVVVVAHLCRDAVNDLAHQIAGLGVDMIGGGHCNEWYANIVNEVVVLGGGTQMANYAYAQFTVDTDAKTVVKKTSGTGTNKNGAPYADVAAIVSGWKVKADEELDVVIGYSRSGIPKRSPEMQSLVVGAWLAEYPADVALTNLGGFRSDIKPGDVTIGDIISVMPFSNVIVDVKLTGEELEKVMAGKKDSMAIAGMTYHNGEWVLAASGKPLIPTEPYTVLVNDFMYNGGDDFTFAKYDPQGYNTGIDWRQPVIDWITSQNSNKSSPIDAAISLLMK